MLEKKDVNEYTYETKLIFALGIISPILAIPFIYFLDVSNNPINIGLIGAVVPVYNLFLASKEIAKDNDRELRNRLRGIGVILTWMSIIGWLYMFLIIIAYGFY